MKTQHLILAVLGILVLGGGYFFFTNQPTPKAPSPTKIQNIPARYLDYSSDNFAKATENKGRAVLWFAALAWCPSCQAADRDFKAHFDKVPKDVTILKIDYDKDTAMKQKYAITTQDTFIQVDSQGKEIARWNSGGQGVEALLANAR